MVRFSLFDCCTHLLHCYAAIVLHRCAAPSCRTVVLLGRAARRGAAPATAAASAAALAAAAAAAAAAGFIPETYVSPFLNVKPQPSLPFPFAICVLLSGESGASQVNGGGASRARLPSNFGRAGLAS